MGGEGSMSQANQSLKYNRSQTGRRNFKDIKDLMRSSSGKTKIEFEKIDSKELERIKNDIRYRARKRRKKLIILYVVISIIITITFYLILN